MSAPPVTLVHACLRGGAGGSPTAVVLEEAHPNLSDEERRRVPVNARTSHAVYVRVHPGETREPTVDLRFFTAEGELPACGHGTVAALAYLAHSASRNGAPESYQATLRTARRVFEGWSEPRGGHFAAAFDPGPVDLREPTEPERALALKALGVARDEPGVDEYGADGPGADRPGADGPGQDVRVAAMGRERLLVPVPDRAALTALNPDFDQLRAACDRFGLLGAYVYSPPSPSGSLAARMFAPSIGVPEDIANANSSACLAAYLAAHGTTELTIDMGDALGSPATITTTATPGPRGPRIQLGGTARVEHMRNAPRA
ncbi:PhzF family phenazine biosynthesis protein [Streptomyces sp. NPDC091209]|uniref:PhzF family phenazine biosynthesis protein n=1 Tax=Streptomyces sp. NPDC091209 TaxID=3365974 RepID=UPI003824A40C